MSASQTLEKLFSRYLGGNLPNLPESNDVKYLQRGENGEQDGDLPNLPGNLPENKQLDLLEKNQSREEREEREESPREIHLNNTITTNVWEEELEI